MKAFITAIGVFALGLGVSAMAADAPAKGSAKTKATAYTVGMTGVT